MEQEIAVVDTVHGTVGEQATDMLLQFLAVEERVLYLLYHRFLLAGEGGGVVVAEGGEEGIGECVRALSDGCAGVVG